LCRRKSLTLIVEEAQQYLRVPYKQWPFKFATNGRNMSVVWSQLQSHSRTILSNAVASSTKRLTLCRPASGSFICCDLTIKGEIASSRSVHKVQGEYPTWNHTGYGISSHGLKIKMHYTGGHLYIQIPQVKKSLNWWWLNNMKLMRLETTATRYINFVDFTHSLPCSHDTLWNSDPYILHVVADKRSHVNLPSCRTCHSGRHYSASFLCWQIRPSTTPITSSCAHAVVSWKHMAILWILVWTCTILLTSELTSTAMQIRGFLVL
jgi:hypothetical protein